MLVREPSASVNSPGWHSPVLLVRFLHSRFRSDGDRRDIVEGGREREREREGERERERKKESQRPSGHNRVAATNPQEAATKAAATSRIPHTVREGGRVEKERERSGREIAERGGRERTRKWVGFCRLYPPLL